MQTKKLYYANSYISEFIAKVTSCNFDTNRNLYAIQLDQTAFYPEGGGQLADVGKIANVDIVDVREEGESILHFSSSALEIGTVVDCKVDFALRFDLMQQHTGEHIVSGIINQLYGFDNVGFHMSDSITIDFNGELDSAQLEKVELMANQAVYKNLPVVTDIYNEESIKNQQFRSKKQLTGEIRLVNIDGYDRCACCGTHLKFTGSIGTILLLSAQKHRSGTRITMVCGNRAHAEFTNCHRSVLQISQLLSAKQIDVADAVDKQCKELVNLRQQNADILQKFFKLKAQSISPANVIIAFEEDMTPITLRDYAVLLSQKSSIMACIFTPFQSGFKYALCSQTTSVSDLCKKLNSTFSGRGGGKPNLVQGSMENCTQEQVEQFLHTQLISFT